MDKTKLQAKLFLFYLRFKKPIIALSIVAAATIIGLDIWQQYKYRTTDQTPWKLVDVKAGDRFTVARHNETKVINLCGVAATRNESKKFRLYQTCDVKLINKQGKRYRSEI